MNKYSKPLSLSPQARLPEGARILMPQRVDVTSDKAITKQAFSRSQQNIEPSLNPSPRVKKMKNETLHDIQRKDLKSSSIQRRADTVQGNEHYKGLGGILKNTFNGPRPTTSGEGYLGSLQSPKTQQLNRPDSKLKKLNSLFPTYKAGDFMGGQQKATEYNFETTKEDREAVQELEKWDSEFKVLAVPAKKVEADQKKDNSQMPFQGEYFENYKTPMLNREILNLIDEDEGFADKDPKLVAANISKLNKQKARVPQKSIETIMTEYNKKILNEILFQRVSKKMNIKESPTHNRLDLDYTTKTVSTDTIGNFKNLQHTLQTNPRIIEYEELYKKLAVQRKPPEKIFDFEEDCRKMQDAEDDYESIEAGLKTKYEAIIVEIHKKKDTLNEIRLGVHNNNNEITELEEEIEDLMKKYEALESQNNQQKEQNKVLLRSNTRAKRGAMNNAPRSTAFVEEYSKLQRQMDEKKEQIRDLKDMIANLESENSKNQQRAENFEREIKDLKFKKNQIKIQLKQQYFKMLKNEDHIFKNEASFITIIKNLWKINEDIVEDMFPGFVDKESLSYLIENARLEYELEQLEALTRSGELKEYRYSEPQQFEEAKNRFRESQKSLKAPLSEQLSDVKKRLQNLKKGIVKMKKPVFIKDGASKSRVIRWEELNFDNDDWNPDQFGDHAFQEKVNSTIRDIKAKLAELKEKEINRIFSLYINKDVDEKNLKNLNKILISLFGRHDAEKTYHAFVRLKQTHDLKISQNKTFVFSSTKQFSSSKTNDKSKNSVIMMLSNATNFRNEKPKGNKDQEEQDKRKVDTENFNKQLSQYQEISNLEVNANYNLNFNYAPGYLDKDFRSSFYLSKSVSPKEAANSLKSSMKDRDRLMIKTSESFNKVSFKEPAKLY